MGDGRREGGGGVALGTAVEEILGFGKVLSSACLAATAKNKGPFPEAAERDMARRLAAERAEGRLGQARSLGCRGDPFPTQPRDSRYLHTLRRHVFLFFYG